MERHASTKGKSKLVFVTDGTESAVAKIVANGQGCGIAGASIAQQALKAGLVDELYLHIAPILLGDGVRLFEHLGDDAIRVRKISSLDAEDGPKGGHAAHDFSYFGQNWAAPSDCDYPVR